MVGAAIRISIDALVSVPLAWPLGVRPDDHERLHVTLPTTVTFLSASVTPVI